MNTGNNQTEPDFVICYPRAGLGTGSSCIILGSLLIFFLWLITIKGVDEVFPNVNWDFSEHPNPKGDLVILGVGLLVALAIILNGLSHIIFARVYKLVLTSEALEFRYFKKHRIPYQDIKGIEFGEDTFWIYLVNSKYLHLHGPFGTKKERETFKQEFYRRTGIGFSARQPKDRPFLAVFLSLFGHVLGQILKVGGDRKKLKK
jgi:hypothetical protein